jgi:hypothetical protein
MLSKNISLKPLSNFYTFVNSASLNGHYQIFVDFKEDVYYSPLTLRHLSYIQLSV